MVDQVRTGTENSNLFNSFILANNKSAGRNFYLQPQIVPSDSVTISEQSKVNSNVSNDNLANDNTVEIPQKRTHRKRKLAYAVGSSALLVGGGMLFMMRGLPKNTEKYLEKLKKYLEKKLEHSSKNGSESWSEFWEYSIRKVSSFIDKSQSINNFTSLKDVLFKNLMDRTAPTARIHKGITDYFEKLARKTVFSSYRNTEAKFKKMNDAFDRLDEEILRKDIDELYTYKGKQYSKKELVQIAKNLREKINQAVTDFISPKEQQSRYEYIKNSTSELYKQFWDESFKGFWSKENKFRRREMWQSYIPDEKIKGNKKSLTDEVSAVRNKISYTDKDRIGIVSRHVKILKNTISPSDKEGLEVIRRLEYQLDNPDCLDINIDHFMKALERIEERPLEKGLDESIIKKQMELRKNNIEKIKSLMKDKNGGELQEMLEIYRKLVPPYDLKESKIETVVKKAVSSFDKALKTETTEFFDKVRDLQLGSAPTDILSILASGGMIAYGLGDAKDNDERISVILTAGIPILGTIGTTVICTTKLISGGLALALGTGVGAVLQQGGKFLDNRRELLAKQKNPTNDEGNA